MHLAIGEISIGGRRSFVGTVTDLTQLKMLQDQLHQAQKLEAVGRLTGGVAHDSNNLLAATMTNAQLLELELEGQDDLNAMASSIVQASKKGAELTHRLLAFSRQQALQPETVQLGSLCGELLDLLRRSLGETYKIVLSERGDLWNVMADPGEVESALLNLAINAMPDGGQLEIVIENASVTNPEWADR